MRLTGYLLSAIGFVCLLTACSGEPNAIPAAPSVVSFNGGTAARGGGGAGKNQDVTIEFSGNIYTSEAQPAVIDRDTKSDLKILAGADNRVSAFYDTFDLSSGVVDMDECVVYPSDASVADVDDVILALDDPYQVRDRVTIQIGKKDGTGILYHNWDDADTGVRYRTWLRESTVTSPTDDVSAGTSLPPMWRLFARSTERSR
jgi:hypothetical protein